MTKIDWDLNKKEKEVLIIMVYNRQPLDYCKTIFINSYSSRLLLYEGLQRADMSHYVNIHGRSVVFVINSKDKHTRHWLPKRGHE